jgi:methylthioribose-1-phosphate isomerase|nr:MAG TPA: Protein of unknown function (DUF2514) [Caudoviricetes sp.]
MTWLKWAGAALAAAALFVSGYKYAAALYEADIADMQTQHALAMKEKTDEYRSKEQFQAKQLADAWDQLERARAESVDLRDDVERVRKLADDYRARLSAAGSASCAPDRERLASCTKLLEEGAKLSAEGAELAQRIAEKKDALSTMTRLAD